MMVSKVAVIALVAIVAAPILLGYAFNLSEVTVKEYKPDGDPVNVTQLLQSGTEYTSAKADIYRINTDFKVGSSGIQTMPIYESRTYTNTSLLQFQQSMTLIPNNNYWAVSFSQMLSDFYAYAGGGGINMEILDLDGGTTRHAVDHVIAVHYHHDDNIVEYQTYTSVGYFTPYSTSDLCYIHNIGTSNFVIYASGTFSTVTNTYVDLSGGFHFANLNGVFSQQCALLNLPNDTRSTLLTINLDSITDSTYSVLYKIGKVYFKFEKTTTNGVVSWVATQQRTDQNNNLQDVNQTDLYYNPSGNNTYQLLVTSDMVSSRVSGGITYYTSNWHTELRYIGAWPTLIGIANYYIKYEYDWQNEATSTNYYNSITIGSTAYGTQVAKTPTMRLDDAEFKAFAYSLISNQTYTPSDFKDNPRTTLTVNKAGISIGFGGNTYTTDTSGNITLGTHKVSTDGLVLESLPVAGGYENRINGYTISTTAQPSTIVFNGLWGASVSTVANAESSHTATEWTPGQFAWNGIDTNFLMVGLITVVGVFIGIGIYARIHRMSIWPLLIVCGGAAALFLFMI